MLYLAQVRRNEFLNQYYLRLLARQEDKYLWTIINDDAFILIGKGNSLAEKLLVLVELSPSGEIEKIEDATSWVLYLIQTYLIPNITPEFLQEQATEIEDWRQSLTLQNQDLARRSLELEARREQIQALETKIEEQNGAEHQPG
jgi:hypothetical protein